MRGGRVRLPWRRSRPTLSERVARALERGGVLVDELTITEEKKGHITLRGPVDAGTVRLRATELARTVDGVRAVDDRLFVVEPAVAPAEREARAAAESVYVVQAGDTLPDIAERLFGARRRWPELLRLNERVVSDPRILQPGLRLRLPER
jgi:nucleoid-associated protein YgaU